MGDTRAPALEHASEAPGEGPPRRTPKGNLSFPRICDRFSGRAHPAPQASRKAAIWNRQRPQRRDSETIGYRLACVAGPHLPASARRDQKVVRSNSPPSSPGPAPWRLRFVGSSVTVLSQGAAGAAMGVDRPEWHRDRLLARNCSISVLIDAELGRFELRLGGKRAFSVRLGNGRSACEGHSTESALCQPSETIAFRLATGGRCAAHSFFASPSGTPALRRPSMMRWYCALKVGSSLQ